MNPAVTQLPLHIKTLWTATSIVANICTTLKLGPPHSYDGTREGMRMANNAVELGKRTVNVAAALKVLYSKQANPSSLATVMGFKTSLPAALVSRLQTLQDRAREVKGEPDAESSARQVAKRAASPVKAPVRAKKQK
eukprot:2951211-Heterocapsa_arctica.AAC.1